MPLLGARSKPDTEAQSSAAVGWTPQNGRNRSCHRAERAGPVRCTPTPASSPGATMLRPSLRVQEVALTDVEAHITGTVWKIEVGIGDSVEEGDTVVILESMKMEMPVEAEDPGVVKEIRCTEGQSVSEGDTLVVLE
jgi:acetyl-CoA carboxylase biotin carboxyl carrier protein